MASNQKEKSSARCLKGVEEKDQVVVIVNKKLKFVVFGIKYRRFFR